MCKNRNFLEITGKREEAYNLRCFRWMFLKKRGKEEEMGKKKVSMSKMRRNIPEIFQFSNQNSRDKKYFVTFFFLLSLRK